MVFVEFTLDSPRPGGFTKHFYVGASLESVLADTNNGTGGGIVTFHSHRVVTEEEVSDHLRLSDWRFIDLGIRSVRAGKSTSYNIGPGF